MRPHSHNSSERVYLLSIVIPVFRDAIRAIELVRTLQGQRLPSGFEIEIIVVDDGSNDGSANRIKAVVGKDITLLRLSKNSGRAIARNNGAAAARGETLLFMDCDCLPVSDDLIIEHMRAWAADVVATIGPVVGNGDGFWHRYQVTASERRARQHASGINFSGSSQNLMVKRTAFDACGGFDSNYCTYGFEDRDLQIRIARYGRIVWATTASVRHMDSLALPLVCRKMIEAGGAAAVLFSHHHPEAYRVLGYAHLDARQHAWLRPLARLLDHLIEPMARYSDLIIASRCLPYKPKSWLVKALIGLSYLVGTARPTHLI